MKKVLLFELYGKSNYFLQMMFSYSILNIKSYRAHCWFAVTDAVHVLLMLEVFHVICNEARQRNVMACHSLKLCAGLTNSSKFRLKTSAQPCNQPHDYLAKPQADPNQPLALLSKPQINPPKTPVQPLRNSGLSQKPQAYSTNLRLISETSGLSHQPQAYLRNLRPIPPTSGLSKKPQAYPTSLS